MGWLVARFVGHKMLVGVEMAAVRVSCSLLGLALLATPCSAQSPPTPDTIVVTGKAPGEPTRREDYDRALELSGAGHGRKALYETALARFKAPVCPGMVGFHEEYAEMVVGRIRANAARLGVPVASWTCSPNLILAVVSDGEALAKALARKRLGIVQAVPDSPEFAAAAPLPVHVLNNVVQRWTGAGPPPRDWPKMKASVRGQLNRSILPEARDLTSAIVVIDSRAAIGLTVTQLADYATLRGLSQVQPIAVAGSDSASATIAGLFVDGARDPQELTSFDAGYLRSLYNDIANRPAVSTLLGVRRRAEAERKSTTARQAKQAD